MPAIVAVVLDEPGFAEQMVQLLIAAGHDAVAFPDSMVALNSLKDARQIKLVVTSVSHAPGTPNGVSLVLTTRNRRPGMRAIFVGPSHTAYPSGMGRRGSTTDCSGARGSWDPPYASR